MGERGAEQCEDAVAGRLHYIAVILQAQRTMLRPTERAAFAEVVPCTLKTGCDPSTSVGMTEGAHRPVTVHHDLIDDEPGKENRQSLSEVVCPAC